MYCHLTRSASCWCSSFLGGAACSEGKAVVSRKTCRHNRPSNKTLSMAEKLKSVKIFMYSLPAKHFYASKEEVLTRTSFLLNQKTSEIFHQSKYLLLKTYNVYDLSEVNLKPRLITVLTYAFGQACFIAG